MAEENKELSHEEVRNDMYSVMADTLQDMRESEEETPEQVVSEPEETVNAESESTEPEKTDTDTPTYQEAENAQQDARSAEVVAEESTEAVSDSTPHEARSRLDEEDAEVYGNLKPKAQERFEHWINRAKELEEENKSLENPKQMWQYVDESKTTGEQLQWAVELFRNLNSGNYDAAQQALKSIDQFADKIGDALGVNKNYNERATYEDFEDLKSAVDNLEINEDWANNLATERASLHSQNQAQERFSQAQTEQMQYNHQYEQQKGLAYNQIDTWERGIRESDADYASKKEIMLDIGREIAASDIPPQNWLSTLEQQYNVLTRGMSAASTKNGNASKKSGPLAPSRTSGGIESSNTLNTAEVTTDFLKATLDEMRN